MGMQNLLLDIISIFGGINMNESAPLGVPNYQGLGR